MSNYRLHFGFNQEILYTELWGNECEFLELTVH